jgi:hypothetical protein
VLEGFAPIPSPLATPKPHHHPPSAVTVSDSTNTHHRLLFTQKNSLEGFYMDKFHGELIMYQTTDGLTKIEARFCDGTVWLTLARLKKTFYTIPTTNTNPSASATWFGFGANWRATNCTERSRLRKRLASFVFYGNMYRKA